MYKRIISAVLLLAMLLSVTSCGGGPAAGGETKDPGGEASRPAGGTEQTKDPEGDGSQPSEEPAAAASFIFSDRPVAALEVTGLDLKNVYEGNYIDKAGDDFGPIHFVKLTPGENSFILFCIYSDDESMLHSGATIHSPAGNSQWEGKTYSCFDTIIDNLPEGYTLLEKNFWDGEYVFNEAQDGGEYYSTLDVWLNWIQFAQLYHPDAAQDDSIYVIDVIPYSFDEKFDTVEECLGSLVKTFAELGASATEIDVDEALARCRVEVSQ